MTTQESDSKLDFDMKNLKKKRSAIKCRLTLFKKLQFVSLLLGDSGAVYPLPPRQGPASKLDNIIIWKTLAQVADDRVLANSQDIEDVSFTVVSGRKWKNKKKRCNTLLTSSSEDAKGPGQCHRCQLMVTQRGTVTPNTAALSAREPIRHGSSRESVTFPKHSQSFPCVQGVCRGNYRGCPKARASCARRPRNPPSPGADWTAVNFPALPKTVAQPVPA
ncbi:hypothetical protein ACJJTC_000431 [Scirpophaga incertulas]